MTVNLFSSMFKRSLWQLKKIGIIIVHLGGLLLLVGGGLTAYFSSEGNMVIAEGETSNYVDDYHKMELAFVNNSLKDSLEYTVVDESLLFEGSRFRIFDEGPEIYIISNIKNALQKKSNNSLDFRRVENVGPKVSAELLKSGIIAISVALALMLIYIWIRFEWQFSLGAIVALFHDVIVTLGLFSLLGLEINLSIIAAVLTIVGYSMNDTVVIFDRVRENLRKYSDIKIFELTNISINETLSRTLITSVTTLLALLSIFFFGGEVLKGFSLAMIFGVIFGTYSSIYIANTVLVRLNVSQKTVLREDKN